MSEMRQTRSKWNPVTCPFQAEPTGLKGIPRNEASRVLLIGMEYTSIFGLDCYNLTTVRAVVLSKSVAF